MNTHYNVTRHAFVCLRERQYIVLDLKRDRYLSFDYSVASALANDIGGWPKPPNAEHAPNSISMTRTKELLSTLLRMNIITAANADGTALRPLNMISPSRSLSGDDGPVMSTRYRYRATGFLKSIAKARLLLKAAPFSYLLHRSRVRLSSSANCKKSADIDHLRHAVGSFNWLRPFGISKVDHCLVESMALMEFISKAKCYPQCVVGIRTRPFAAHAWLQQDDLVLNDRAEYVATFTPIVVI